LNWDIASCQSDNYHIGLNTMPGFLIAHREDAKNLEAHVMGYELQWSRRNMSEHPWAQQYKSPRIGLNIMYMDLGNPELTGKAFCIGPNFETTLFRQQPNNIQFRAGTGWAYLTKKFDPKTNRRNQSIGSNFNSMMQLKLAWLHQFKTLPMESTVGIGITHFSNGSIRVPNLGVNMPTLFFGLNYVYRTSDKPYDARDTIRIPKWNVHMSYAFKERSLAKTTSFNLITFGVERIFRKSLTRQWRVGGDIFFDKTHQFSLEGDQPMKGLTPQEMTEIGVFGGHQWLIYKVHLIVDLGFYLYKPSNTKLFTYQRLGFKYQIHDNWFLKSTLKAHLGVADFLDWGIGYKF